ncbi:MAG: GntR family transcriptional regulator [Clostridia bacterium]|nr:GntR family transcriptional regulator [Clostridia bacterium]
MFRIDNMSRTPIYEQLIDQFEKFILTGALLPGSQIPSVRNLSIQLSINPNTVQKAYSELDSRSLIYSLPGKGSFVSIDAKQRIESDRTAKLDDLAQVVSKLKEAGIDKELLLSVIERYYN